MLRIFFLLLLLKGTLMAIEEPKYTVIQKNDTFEIREYAPFLVAQTEVTGSFDEMGGKAFRILFNYISGENQQRSNIKMTAPVIQENKKVEGQKIQMTAPVIQDIDATNPNRALYSFVMPEEFTLETLPKPLDKRITVKEIPAKRVAVRVFSGSWSKKNFKDNEAVLLNALKAAHIKTKGKTSFARYNSPFSLWFMRRNEVMIEVK
ncbi:heme-binding protein [Sulfurovum sp.]|uniref:SOUL family heme-binding protein n=1 Tax=Sulfurovum sp. TaxID=1969726 RepID=UPI0025EA45F1|nr:heme-binding protein [Sulfurovum sp.]